jgi:hypothetical protein
MKLNFLRYLAHSQKKTFDCSMNSEFLQSGHFDEANKYDHNLSKTH